MPSTSVSWGGWCWRTQHLVAWRNYYDLLCNPMDSQKRRRHYAHTQSMVDIVLYLFPSTLTPEPLSDYCLFSSVTSTIWGSRVTFLTNVSSTSGIGQARKEGLLSLTDQSFWENILQFSLVKINWNFCGSKMPAKSKAEKVMHGLT